MYMFVYYVSDRPSSRALLSLVQAWLAQQGYKVGHRSSGVVLLPFEFTKNLSRPTPSLVASELHASERRAVRSPVYDTYDSLDVILVQGASIVFRVHMKT
jgi:hypothetical protein